MRSNQTSYVSSRALMPPTYRTKPNRLPSVRDYSTPYLKTRNVDSGSDEYNLLHITQYPTLVLRNREDDIMYSAMISDYQKLLYSFTISLARV